jgi:hypothetical protein
MRHYWLPKAPSASHRSPVTELTYPAFPRRALGAFGAVLVALCGVAIAVNRSGPDVPGCAAAAARVMTARNYSVPAMTRLGPGRVAGCGGLTTGQYAQAVADAYVIDYGRRLPHAPVSGNVPPASFRALSAQTASRKR